MNDLTKSNYQLDWVVFSLLDEIGYQPTREENKFVNLFNGTAQLICFLMDAFKNLENIKDKDKLAQNTRLLRFISTLVLDNHDDKELVEKLTKIKVMVIENARKTLSKHEVNILLRSY